MEEFNLPLSGVVLFLCSTAEFKQGGDHSDGSCSRSTCADNHFTPTGNTKWGLGVSSGIAARGSIGEIGRHRWSCRPRAVNVFLPTLLARCDAHMRIVEFVDAIRCLIGNAQGSVNLSLSKSRGTALPG
jgi:hypothetical protein